LNYISNALGAPLGDAILAGLGAGILNDFRVIENWLPEKLPTTPESKNMKLYDQYYKLYKIGLETSHKLNAEISAIF